MLIKRLAIQLKEGVVSTNRRIRSEEELDKAIAEGWAIHVTCRNCSMKFSNDIVHTPEGWRRTQSEGICEDCYEDILDNTTGLPD
jgi:superfamily II helicase